MPRSIILLHNILFVVPSVDLGLKIIRPIKRTLLKFRLLYGNMHILKKRVPQMLHYVFGEWKKFYSLIGESILVKDIHTHAYIPSWNSLEYNSVKA